jgi:hypothetical protein
MAIRECKICHDAFYAKPSHVKNGWGMFCSRECKNIGMRVRKPVNCFVCGKLVYKTRSQVEHSQSGKLFCGKSCQTKWRNVEYSGNKHLGWKGGRSLYRKIMLKSGKLVQCALCRKKDLRILAVHHIDKDHSNLKSENLIWLCHNCHYLVHHDRLEKQRLESLLRP